MKTIHEVDLNLLKLLHIIFETKSLTKAGEQVGLTQSAVSHALKKIRVLFKDPLVIRQGHTLILTAKAIQLETPLRIWLNQFQTSILENKEFVPTSSHRLFTIAATDQFEQLILPKVIKKLRKVSPHIQLSVINWEPSKFYSQLENGDIDLAVGVQLSTQPNIMQTTLYDETISCIVRKGHPLLKHSKSLSEFILYPHVLISTNGKGKGVVDEALEKKGLARTVSYRVSNFSSAPYLIEASDAILTAPTRFLERIATKHDVVLFPSPVKISSFAVKMFWHEKFNLDPASRWLRDLMREFS